MSLFGGGVGVGTNQVCLSTSLCAKVTRNCVPWGTMKSCIYFSHLTDGKTKELEVDASLGGPS